MSSQYNPNIAPLDNNDKKKSTLQQIFVVPLNLLY